MKSDPVEFVFTFDSVHDAIIGEKKLKDAGIGVMVMPRPHQLGSRCGICLRVLPPDLERALAVVKNRGEIYAASLPETPPGKDSQTAPIAFESRKTFTEFHFDETVKFLPKQNSLSGWFQNEFGFSENGEKPCGRDRTVSVTVTGSGGKTSLIMLLAESQRRRKVLVAPSARILRPEEGSYDRLIPSAHSPALDDPVPGGITVAGELNGESDKIESFPLHILEKQASRYDLVLMEGDGSRGLPLKGWADYEPVVPSFTSFTVAIMPLWPLGSPASEKIIHRLPLFCAISGAVPDETITPGHLAAVIVSRKGLFAKARGRRILFFNQVENSEDMEKARELRGLIRESFRGKVIAGSVSRNFAEVLE
jgi:probable selenium-dependent hydroxylase accessory protein YqeC